MLEAKLKVCVGGGLDLTKKKKGSLVMVMYNLAKIIMRKNDSLYHILLEIEIDAWRC